MKPLVLAFLLILAGCAAVQKIQRPPDPEPGRIVWREWLNVGELR